MMAAPWLQGPWATWQRRLGEQRVPHAVLVAGSAGLGKRQLAAQICGSLLCAATALDARPCGDCRGCKLLTAGTHPDFYPIALQENTEGKLRTQIVIEQIRTLCDKLAQTSQFGGWRVALIDPADAMNTASFNALLKTLEEPEGNAVLLLVSDRPSQLPATIRSRCQRIDLRFPPREQALAWLQCHGIPVEAANQALDLAAGNPGLARAYGADAARVRLQSTLDDLFALARSKARAAEVAAAWIKDEPEERLLLAAQSLRVAAWSAQGQGPASGALSDLAGLTARLDFPKLAAWWDRANVVREQLKTPLRADLLLIELLRDFRAMVPVPQTAKG